MVPRVVDDENGSTPRPRGDPSQLLQEGEECVSVELALFSAKNEFAIPKPHGSEVADTLPGRVVQQNGVLLLGWNPHLAARTVLLEMNFVLGPDLNITLLRQGPEFFYIAPAPPGQPWQSPDVVYADGSQAAGRSADTGGLPG